MDEKELMFSLKGGDRQSFERLISAYSPRLLRAAILLCHNQEEAEDAVQDTFLRVLNAARNFNGRSTVFTWLYGILLNVIREAKRKNQIVALPISDSRFEVGRCPKKDNLVDHRENLSTVGGFLSKLSSRHQEVMILRYYEGLTIQEISTAPQTAWLEKSVILVLYNRRDSEIKIIKSESKEEVIKNGYFENW